VVTHETHRVKLDKIGEFEMNATNEPEELFVTLMSSINPFAKFVIQEIMNENCSSADKLWELDEQIF